MDKLILKLSRVNAEGKEELVCTEELRSLAILGDCWNDDHKLMEVLAQTSIKDVAFNMLSTDKLYKAADLAVFAKKIFGAVRDCENDVNELEDALRDQIEEGLQ